MYDIYIQNFLDENGDNVPEERLLYHVPIADTEHPLSEPSIKLEMGKTGSMEFKVYPEHPLYNKWRQMKTIMRVVYDGDTIFRGRVLTIDLNPLTGEKKLHLEGDMAFLLDSQYEGVQEEKRTETDAKTFISDVLWRHNLAMEENGDDEKRIWPGEIPGQYSAGISAEQRISTDTRKYGSDGWTTSWNVLEDLTKEFGGYFRTRYSVAPFVDEIGQYGQGNIDLNHRTVIHNPDGSISTECSFSTWLDDKEVLLPTVINGAIVSEEDAIRYYKQNGEYLGKFDTSEAAEDYAYRLHDRQTWYYGGRPATVERVYLDWLDYCYRVEVNGQPIQIRENLIELNCSTEVDNIFTALVPIGSDNKNSFYLDDYKTDIHGAHKWILVPDLLKIFSDEKLNAGYHHKSDYEQAVNRYGMIFKTQSFSNAKTKEQLWEYATDWMLNNYVGGISSFSLTALDMHHVNGTVSKYLVGDRVTAVYPDMDQHTEGITPTISRILTLTNAQYHPHNPEKNTYTLGIPSNALNKTYGQAKSGGGGGGGGVKNPDEEDPRITAHRQQMEADVARVIVRWSEDPEIVNIRQANPVLADDILSCSSILLREKFVTPEMEVLPNGHIVEKPGSSTAEKHLRRMGFNLETGRLDMCGIPNALDDPAADFTTEELEKLNRTAGNIYFDTLKNGFGMGTVPDIDDNGNLIPSTTLIEQQVKETEDKVKAEMKMFSDEKLTDPDAPPTISNMGDLGAMLGEFLGVGENGSGLNITSLQDGKNAVMSWIDTNLPDFAGGINIETVWPQIQTAMLEGKNISDVMGDLFGATVSIGGKGDGEVNVGKKPEVPSDSRKWKVTINKPITYVVQDGDDEEGQPIYVEKTLSKTGLVCADEIYLPEIGSFKTKLAVIDNLIADRATINELEAVDAKIESLAAVSITTENLAAELADIAQSGIDVLQANKAIINTLTLTGEGQVYWTGYRDFVTSVDFENQTVTTVRLNPCGRVGNVG